MSGSISRRIQFTLQDQKKTIARQASQIESLQTALNNSRSYAEDLESRLQDHQWEDQDEVDLEEIK